MSGALSENLPKDAAVYTGFWINWSSGLMRGATLTVANSTGGVITAFLALFVTVVGTSLWRLLCFVLHTKLSARQIPRDGFYHQQQVILRNASTAMDGLKSFAQLAWKWRDRSTRRRRQIIPLISGMVLLSSTFFIASILSSQV